LAFGFWLLAFGFWLLAFGFWRKKRFSLDLTTVQLGIYQQTFNVSIRHSAHI